MKKFTLILLMITLLIITACKHGNQKNIYLPKAGNDKVYTSVTDGDETHRGEGYTISVPPKNYHYEKDCDDGVTEEKWEYAKNDDVEIKVTTYKNSDEISARTEFLKDNEDYIFEDLMGYSLCGQNKDGDTLWFNLHISGETVYIISWKFPRNTGRILQKELSEIAGTFAVDE